jgi:multidrug efflux pump subunit AcrA (membrane-fusion protein)
LSSTGPTRRPEANGGLTWIQKGGGGLRAKRTGTVTRIADALQPGTRTLLTEIDVPNTDGTLAPAIYCTVELHIPRKVNSVLVPSEAIRPAGHRRRQRHCAYPPRSGGAGSGKLSDGVKTGDQVVLNPGVNLVEGSKVRVGG